MAYQEIKTKHVIGRKQYECEWCGDKILVKEKHLSRAYSNFGEFFAARMHLDCEEAMNKSDYGLLSGGFYPGEFKRGEPLR